MFDNFIFNKSPTSGQLAVNGEWEKAVIFKPGEFCTLEEAKSYIGEKSEVAFEAFFDAAFFGIRQKGSSENLCKLLLNFALAIRDSRNGIDFFETILTDYPSLLVKKFEFAEIGAANAWNSVGAYMIPDPIAWLSNFEKFWKDLSLAPVSKNSSHRKAIEFAFDNGDGTTHWFAFPVSNDIPPYEVDAEKLKNALQICRLTL